MKIGGVYILTLRNIKRMIVAISAAFAAFCASAATPNDMMMATRCATTSQNLLALQFSLGNSGSAYAVVPEPLYLERSGKGNVPIEILLRLQRRIFLPR